MELDYGRAVSQDSFLVLRLSESCSRNLYSDPPKAIADIVESLLGAIFLDSGIEAALAAATRMLTPVFEAIPQLQRNDADFSLTHPKKALQEILGEILHLDTSWEHEFSSKQQSKVLDGPMWRFPDPYSTNIVGYIHFMDSILMAVSDASGTVARNKACAAVVHVLKESDWLLGPLQQLRQRVERFLAQQSRQEEVDDEAMGTLL